MSASSPELSSLDSLLREQEVVQTSKFQGRQLREYNSYIFPGQEWREPVSSAIVDFLRPYCGDDERVSLEGVLKGLILAQPNEPVRLADMGGGRGLALRQLAAHPGLTGNILCTNVDLFNYGINDLDDHDIAHLENNAPGCTSEACAPRLVRANAEAVQLCEPMDIITSVEVMQYLDNPLASLCNWYNNLADNGLLIVSAEHDWSSWIRPDGIDMYAHPEAMPAAQFLQALDTAGVSYAASYESDWRYSRPKLNPCEFKNLVVQKKPGTQLRMHAVPARTWVNPFDYKAVYYASPDLAEAPFIEVVRTEGAE